MAYERIDWENEPSVDTPLNEDNLNHMEDGIVQNETDIAGKMDANNPTGTGSFSLNRKSGTTVGNYSFAEGFDTEASGNNSHAEGSFTEASGRDSHAEGEGTKASGMGSHAAGLFTEASGLASHAGGVDTKALANASYAQNRGTIAASENQTAMGMFNIADNHAKYARIVGNGTDNNNRSNAETLDWDGNHWVAGDYTNGNGETLHGIYEALPVDSASGNPAVITDAFGGACKSLKLTLEPIQSGSGTPSPQNVRPISGRTSLLIVSSGKPNAMPSASAKSGTINNITYSCDGNGKYEVHTTGATQNTTLFFDCPEFIIPDKNSAVLGLMNASTPYNVTFDFYYNESRVNYWLFSALNRITQYGSDMSNKKCNRFAIQVNTSSAFDLVMTPMICYGTTSDFPSAYKPFGGTSITRTYGTTIYGGTDDVTGDGATSSFTATIFDGSDTWSASTIGTNFHQFTIDRAYLKNTENALCDKFPRIALSERGVRSGLVGYSDNTIRISLNDDEYGITTLEAFKTWLGSNNITVVYEVVNPTSIPLTAQNITLLHGDNVITTDADSVEASYSADIALYIAKKIAEGVNSTRSLSKGGSSESTEEVKKEETPKESEEIKEETKEEIKEEIKEETKEEK